MGLLVPQARIRTVLLRTVVLALVLALAVPAVALASPLRELQVVLLLEAGGVAQPLLMLTGSLPEDTTLPAEIVLPVPEGIQADAIAAYQILGGPLQDDPQAEPRLEVRDGVNVAVFELTESRIGKLEIVYTESISVLEDDLRRGAFALTASDPVETVGLSVFAPMGFEVAQVPEGATLEQYPDGALYFVELTGVSPGDELSFGVDFTGAAAPVAASGATPVSQAPDPGGVPVFLLVLVAAVLGGAVLLVLASRPKGDADAEGAGTEAPSQDGREDRADSRAPSKSSAQAKAKAPAAQAAGGSGFAALLTPRNILIAVGVIAIGAIVVLNFGGEGGTVGVTVQEGTIVSQRISTAEPVQTATFTIGIRCQCPPETEANKMFDLLRGAQGVAHAALETVSVQPEARMHTLQVSYDPDRVDAERIAELLATTYDVYDVR